MTKNTDGTWDKSRRPSRHVTEGPARAPHRSYYYGADLGTREIAPRPKAPRETAYGVGARWKFAESVSPGRPGAGSRRGRVGNGTSRLVPERAEGASK
jgi:hypothetical protein